MKHLPPSSRRIRVSSLRRFGAIDSYLSSSFGLTLLALFPCALANHPFPQRFCGRGCLKITSQRVRVIQPSPCKSRDFFLFSLCFACSIMPFRITSAWPRHVPGRASNCRRGGRGVGEPSRSSSSSRGRSPPTGSW